MLTDSASCDEVMPLIAQERVTHVALVPALAQLWVQAREWEDSDLSSLRVIQAGGARLDPTLAEQVIATFDHFGLLPRPCPQRAGLYRARVLPHRRQCQAG